MKQGTKQSRIFLILFVSIFCCCGILRADVSVGVVSSLQRFLQDEVNVDGAKDAEIFCAKAETESFQIIIANDTDAELVDIDLRKGSWRYSGDKPSAGAPVMRMFREHYVMLASPSPWAKSRAGMYPDALIPFVNPYTGKRVTSARYLAGGQSIKAGHSQGYWIDIFVDRDVTAGVYKNEITVLSGGENIAVIPLTVTVWDFELPEIHKLKTYFSGMRNVSSSHGLEENSFRYKTIRKRYQLMLRDHGANQTFVYEPKVLYSTGKAIFTPEYIKRMKDHTEEMKPSIIRVVLPYGNKCGAPRGHDSVKCARTLQSWEEFLRRNPWVPEPVVYTDEPRTMDDYLKIIEVGKLIDEYAPSVKYLVTKQIKPFKSNLPSLEGAVDIWCPSWEWADLANIKRRQKVGDEFWSYNNGYRKEVPSWLIEFPLLHYRVPAWFSWSLDLKGILYWQTMSWSKKTVKIDPWIDCSTFKKVKYSYGEGFLIYPGTDAGVDGPIASMRLKVFRDSMEDFDYFSILADLAGHDEVDAIVQDVAARFRGYRKKPIDYLNARKLLAEKILERL